MSKPKMFVAGLLAFVLSAAWSSAVLASAEDELVAAAKKEGTIEFYGPTTLTPNGARELSAAFNKRYGFNITLQYNPSGNMVRDVSKIVSQALTGVPPQWDAMVVTDAHHATLYLRKLHEPYDYQKLGIDRKFIEYNNGTVAVLNQFILPAYNTKILPAKDVPKTWEDLLEPKWKGGKIGVNTATHHFARLASAWGEEKTTNYVKALAKQEPILGRLGEMMTRLQLGEILIAATLTDGHIERSQKKGAPLAFAEIQPVISPAYQCGVPKNAVHPNVGHLFCAFLLSDESQSIWLKYTGQSSALVPGTPAYKYAQGKKVLFMTQDEAQTVDRLAREYGKILGFGKRKR
ncbi:MAG TPA: ABC transporter substrate-binding protein [Terriglobales bacterium]|nr:ABC transporter substrate-binding protein [Terriglobales bacterium]